MLECSTGNSKSQLHKARLKLRELLRNPDQLPEAESSREVLQ
jgi:RNA polymerase sigma-70 factor (ECF subfamily)